MRALRSLSVFAVVLGSGCRVLSDGARRDSATTVRDSAGVAVVENEFGEDPAASGWRLRPLLVLGDSLDGAPFGEIRSMDVAPDGTILVLDRADGRVTVWSPEGELLRSFGGRGSGPGEVVTPGYVRALGDGGAVVGEVFPPRLHRYDSSGRHLGTRRVRPPADGPALLATMARWRVRRSGEALVQLSYASPSHLDGTPVVLGRLAEGDGIDTLLTWTERTTPARLPRIFEADWSWDLGPDGGVVVAPGVPYELRLRDRTGALRRKIRLSAPAVRVTRALERRARHRFFERFADEDVAEPVLRELGDRLEVAPTLPHVQGVHRSQEGGRIWVEAPTAERTGELEEVGAWDVFDLEGRYLGRVAPPAGFRLEGVRGSLLFGVERDSLGVTRARLYRLGESREGHDPLSPVVRGRDDGP